MTGTEPATSRAEQVRIALRLRVALRRRARYDRLDADGRAEWRAHRLDALRRHAVAHSPRYRDAHQGLERAPLHELPTVTRDDVVERFDELVTDRSLHASDLRAALADGGGGRARGRYRVGVSSGSSGRPSLFPFDEREWTGLLVDAARARRLAGRPVVEGRLRTARIGSPSPWHLSRQVGATLQDPRKPSRTLSAARDIADLAADLQDWQPHVLTGYPSVLAALASQQLAGRLRIAPAQVFAGGEPLSATARAGIVEAWGNAPFDQYLTTEAGFVAIDCPAHDGLHVLDDHVVLEVVDADGAPVAAGTQGARVLLTVLGSRTLPLIRYELDDAVTVATGACPCGRSSPRLRSIAGSPRQLLTFRASSGGEVTVHPVVLTSVLDAVPVGGWQVRHAPDRVHVLVTAPGPGFDGAAVAAALGRALHESGAVVEPVAVEVVDALRRTPSSGKAARLLAADGDAQRRPSR